MLTVVGGPEKKIVWLWRPPDQDHVALVKRVLPSTVGLNGSNSVGCNPAGLADHERTADLLARPVVPLAFLFEGLDVGGRQLRTVNVDRDFENLPVNVNGTGSPCRPRACRYRSRYRRSRPTG